MTKSSKAWVRFGLGQFLCALAILGPTYVSLFGNTVYGKYALIAQWVFLGMAIALLSGKKMYKDMW